MEKKIILEKIDLAEPCRIDLEILDSIDSTNDYLKNQSIHFKTASDLKIVLADRQTQGRGRLGRSWVSPPGENIYFSCRKHFDKNISELSALSLVVSLAVVQALESVVGPIPFSLKWPNDIFYEGAKLSGNLIDIMPSSNGFSTVIIGIGININMQQAPAQPITQAWTSLRKITGMEWDRNSIVSTLVNYLIRFLREFEQKGFDPFVEQWKRYDCLLNQKIILKSTYDDTIMATGIAKGVNAQGQLLLELGNGTTQAFVSGDTSIMNLVYY